jgi:hypothetical protein
MSLPTDFHPGLTESRLMAIGSIIRGARHRAVMHHEPSKGDDEWVLGCRAYRWQCFDVASAADKNPEWLSIIEGGSEVEEGHTTLSGLRFTFAVGGVPLRFYRGSADEVPARSLRRSYVELERHQQAFEFVTEPTADACLRLAVETDDTGDVSRIVLIQVDAEGNPIGQGWTIPETEQRPVKIVAFPKAEGTDLGEPKVGSKKAQGETRKKDESGPND